MNSLAALLAACACGLAFAGLDTLRKTLAARVRPMPLLVVLALGTAPLFVAWWAAEGLSLPRPGYLAPGIGSIALNVAANLAMLEAVRVSPLSLTIPLLSLTPAFAALLAVPLLGERLGGADTLGIALVVAGALALHLGTGQGGLRLSLRRLPAAFVRERGSVLMAGVALLWSLTPALDKLAMARSSPGFHGFALNAGVGAAVLALLAARSRSGELAAGARRSGGMMALAILVSAVALGAQLYAMTLMPVGAVETLKRGIGNLSAVVLGSAIFGEPVTVPKLVAALLMVAGVALIVR